MTGADRGLGLALSERLGAHADVRELRAFGAVDAPTARHLRGVDVVVHLDVSFAADRDSPEAVAEPAGGNVAAAAALLTAAAEANVPRVVLCTSAMVYGADESNAVPLDEDAPLRALPGGGLVAELLEIEGLARSGPHRVGGTDVTVLRPAMLVGEGTDTVLTRHFEAPRLLHLQGARPAWQFCHVADLVSALEYAALGLVSGAVTVGCEGSLEQEEVEIATGMRRVVIPASLAFGTAERLHRFGVSAAPPSELRYVAYPWVVSSRRGCARPAGTPPTTTGTRSSR